MPTPPPPQPNPAHRTPTRTVLLLVTAVIAVLVLGAAGGWLVINELRGADGDYTVHSVSNACDDLVGGTDVAFRWGATTHRRDPYHYEDSGFTGSSVHCSLDALGGDHDHRSQVSIVVTATVTGHPEEEYHTFTRLARASLADGGESGRVSGLGERARYYSSRTQSGDEVAFRYELVVLDSNLALTVNVKMGGNPREKVTLADIRALCRAQVDRHLKVLRT